MEPNRSVPEGSSVDNRHVNDTGNEARGRTRRALIVAHDPTLHGGIVADRLEQRGFQLEQFTVARSQDDPHSEIPFPDPTEFDLIAVFGAVWSVYDTDTIGSWITREHEMLRAADVAGIPLFGVCFGCQSMAAALGGASVPAETPQSGWYHITSEVPEGIVPGPWFEWHSDRIEPPPDARILAYDETCVQAFQLRNHLAVQFHPEITVAQIEHWIAHGGDIEMQSRGVDPQELLAESVGYADQVRDHTYRLVDWFLAEIAELSAGPVEMRSS